MIRKLKQPNRRPTELQIKTAKALAKQIRDGAKRTNYSAAMREAGYSERMSKKAIQLKKSETFRECLYRLMPQELILETHRKLSTAKRILNIAVPKDMGIVEINEMVSGMHGKLHAVGEPMFGKVVLTISVPDTQANNDAIDKWFKVTGRYQSEAPNQENPFEGLDDEKILEEIEKRKLDLSTLPPKPNDK